MTKRKDKAAGFSKLSKSEKSAWVNEHHLQPDFSLTTFLKDYQHSDKKIQKILDGFSENTLANFPMPYGVAPHFIINDREYCVPMVIEESSVVAAASNSAKFWKTRGGIRAEVIDTIKLGNIHFFWDGDSSKLDLLFNLKKDDLEKGCRDITLKMEARGGGIISMELIDMTSEENGLYKIEIKFETCDSMGANFINSVLENVAALWKFHVSNAPHFIGQEKHIDIILRILSNYTPECRVRALVQCGIEDLGKFPNGMTGGEFAGRFYKAVRISRLDPYRATTHNKGIFNGIDAVVLATGNDFRAIESCGHAYAAADGQYRGLSTCTIENDIFTFSLEVPLALGTVGGLTKLHPLAKLSLDILDNPDAKELMKITAAVGLMQNFGAIRSLVTTGIQKGHMKMHLSNILNQFQATEKEFAAAMDHFANKLVSYANVREFLGQLRKIKIGN